MQLDKAMKVRSLASAFFLLVIHHLTVNCQRHNVPSDCMWNSKGQYYLCYLYGVHRKEVITRRIPYSRHMHIAKPYDQIQVLGRLNDMEISWNKRSIILSIQEGYLAGGGQHSRHNLTLSLTTFIDMPDNHPSEETYRVHQVNVPISLVIRSFDVELTKQTTENETILTCTITGLRPDETDIEIRFNDQKRYSCEEDWPNGTRPHPHGNVYVISTNHGSSCQLHVDLTSAELSNNGEYYCRVKFHTDDEKSSIFIDTPTVSVDIPRLLNASKHETYNQNDAYDLNIVTVVATATCTLVVTAVFVLVLGLAACGVYKCRRQGQRANCEPEQVNEHEREREPLLCRQQGSGFIHRNWQVSLDSVVT